jgi:hypothetical protein
MHSIKSQKKSTIASTYTPLPPPTGTCVARLVWGIFTLFEYPPPTHPLSPFITQEAIQHQFEIKFKIESCTTPTINTHRFLSTWMVSNSIQRRRYYAVLPTQNGRLSNRSRGKMTQRVCTLGASSPQTSFHSTQGVRSLVHQDSTIHPTGKKRHSSHYPPLLNRNHASSHSHSHHGAPHPW